MSGQPKKPGFFSRKTLFGATVGVALTFMVFGVLFWGGFNTGMELTNTTEFCISCHEMEENVYREYVGTIHDANRSGVRAGCPDCHVPRPWVHKMVRKIQASNEVLHKVLGTISTPEKFEAHRLTMAKRVWSAMKQTDSRECRNCHDWTTMNPEQQKPRARQQHLTAMQSGNTCIDCHKGVAHSAVHQQLSEEEADALAAPNPALARAIPVSFQQGLERAEQAEAAAEEQRKAEEEKQRAAENTRLDAAVAKALAQYQATATAAVAPVATGAGATAAPAEGEGFGIDWSAVPERRITLFYPGQSSMEWVLRGSDHGGARAFKVGDRCTVCHDKEAAEMGRKIVSGEKLEPTPIPGKPGSIPVNVKAAHDGQYLYMQFRWEGAEHAPAPFVEGGKMDPANPMKLAIMLGSDQPEFADRAGCWGSCHHDARSMPDHPETGAPPEGVGKYLAESRTAIELRGRDGAKLGGWDKRKDEAEIAAALAEGKFLDLLRYNAGDGSTEDGYVLADRVMQGGQGVEFHARQEASQWVVEMRRKLTSDQPGDLSLALDQGYNLGLAIHDDYSDARFHHVSLGYKLGFDSETAEINAVAR